MVCWYKIIHLKCASLSLFTSLHILLFAEKVASCEEVSEETKKTDQEDHLDRIRYEIFDVGEAATFDCLLQEEPLWVCSISIQLKKYILYVDSHLCF